MEQTGRTGTTEGKSNNWFGTLNNPADDPQAVLEDLFIRGKARYLVGQLEKGDSGTPHL